MADPRAAAMKGLMSPPNNPYGSNNNDDQGGPPSFGDYSQNSNDNYNAGYNNAYNGGFEQFPASPENSLQGGGYAGAGRRLVALILDGLVYFVALCLLVLVFAGSDISQWWSEVNDYIEAGNSSAPAPELDMGNMWLVSLLGYVLWFSYRAGMESTRGQTLGKMALGVKVVDADGQPISFVNSLMRNSWYLGIIVLGFIPVIGGLASIVIPIILGVMIAQNQYSQHVSDSWAKAYVVRSRQPH